jgi:DsbC/DsbD-like thiol-disulfide interchange protein
MRTCLIPLALMAAALPAGAEDLPVTARLLPGWQEQGGTRIVGLRLDLAPGWKTYWRAPGEAGIPPVFDWSGSDNLASVRLHWPVPHVFSQGGMRTIGYDGGVVLPVEITPRDPSRPVDLRASVAMGVCRDICVPVEVDLHAVLDGPGAADGAIRAALADVPERGGSADCAVEPIADGLRVTARVAVPDAGGDEMVVLEPREGDIWVSEAQVTRQGGQITAVADMVPPDGAPFALDRGAMRVTVLGDDRVIEIAGCAAN